MRRFSKHHFASFVKSQRERRKLSLRQTAKKSGLTLARVYAIENGEARLSVPQLISLADAFGFKSGADFLGRYERTIPLAKPRPTPAQDKLHAYMRKHLTLRSGKPAEAIG